MPAELDEKPRSDAATENRTASAQIGNWARNGRATLDSSDLPACFIAERMREAIERTVRQRQRHAAIGRMLDRRFRAPVRSESETAGARLEGRP